MKIHILTENQLQKKLDEAKYLGYQLGWNMRQVENTNKGFIIGSKVDSQLAEIFKKELGK